MKRWGWGLAVLLISGTASAETFDVTEGMDLEGVLDGLSAGDEVIVHEGTYVTGGRWNFTWNGTESMPIVVRAAEGEGRPVIQGNRSENVMELDGSYFEMRGLELTGGGHGIRLGMVDHATLEDLRIHDVADVGLSCNRGSASDCNSLIIRRNEIFDTGLASGEGEGMYLGCNRDECRIYDSIIELNYVHDTRSGGQGDGIELKYGSYGNIVRDNVIVRIRNPGILVSSFPPGAGRAPNIVERNVVVDGLNNGIQLGGQAIVRNNLIVDMDNSGIQSQPSTNESGEGAPIVDAVVVHNTVVVEGGTCNRFNEWSGRSGNVVANNAFYCPSGNSMRWGGGQPAAGEAVITNNVVLGNTNGSRGTIDGVSIAADLGNAAALELYPPSGSVLVNAGDAANGAADDFNGEPRDDGSPDVGAYERSGNANPGWTVGEGFKDEPATMPGTDAGLPGMDAGARDAGGRDAGDTDGGSPSRDGGARDAGGFDGGGDGCGCAVATRSDAVVPLLLLALFARRRR